MGVQGLTSYIQQKSDIYFESYQLRNCILIIDGYGLASQLYNSSSKINAAFGGDYDKYCKVISNFFDILKKCKITPLVICDGGYEKKKLSTVKRRNLHRVYALEKVSPSCNNLQCFPLMLRHVFKERLLELSICVFQTDFEADNEIAALAKMLRAPVLSNDSDFYIYDVQYIPLSSIQFDYCESNGKNYYIPCQMFLINNLLKSFGNLPKTMLPLLATVLGNDYIKTSKFKEFYSCLKMDKSKKLKPGQKRVKGIVDWLRGETFESAIAKILQCLKKNARRNVQKNIRYIIKGYTNLNTTLESYLPGHILKFVNKESSAEVLELTNQFKSFCCIESFDESENENCSSDKSDSRCDDEEEESDISISGADNLFSDEEETVCNIPPLSTNVCIPSWLLDESRVGNMCPSVLTLLLLKIYFFCPQVEDYESIWAGSITLPILQVVIGLLGLNSIKYWYRAKCRYISSELLSIKSVGRISFPDLNTLNSLSISKRKFILLKTLKTDSDSVLEYCPPDWQLFFLSIAYWVRINEGSYVKHWHLHALIITIITINVIGEKVGLFWHKKSFLKKYSSKLKSALSDNGSKPDYFVTTNVIEALDAVTFDDSLVALDFLIPYFHMDENLNRNSKKFSRDTIHAYAQLQSIFELAVTLNSLLLQPFKRCHLGKFYNGTFLYNFTHNFKKRSNITLYVESILGKAPSVFNLYLTIYNYVMMLIPEAPQQFVKPKHHKKKKEIKIVSSESCSDEMSDINDFSDCNNRFALLTKQINR